MGFFRRKKTQTPSQCPPAKADQVQCQPPAQSPPRRDGSPFHPPAPAAPFQPAGYLSPPPGWNHAPPPGPPPSNSQYHHDQRQYSPIIVNQHYYLSSPPSHQAHNNPYPSSNGTCALSKLKLGSAADLAHLSGTVNQLLDDGLPRWHSYGTQLLNQGAAMYDQMFSRFDDIMTSIDRDRFIGNENDLFMYQKIEPIPSPPAESTKQLTLPKGHAKKSKKETPKGHTTAVASSLISGGYFAKVELYANSRLPLNLPPLRLYMPTYPLLCLAAQYAERVYDNPTGAERNAHVEADWRTGTKAMCIKSVPMDHMNTIVFAIRGTATFMDWAVNLNTAPAAPTGFLDDPSNFCHSGFLSAARKMVGPVAARLRQLLMENPRRCAYSLLITGHSAGGAIASLLYMHMLATSKAAASELNMLTSCFKRVHCVTFGTPPVSLRPLQTPNRKELKKSLFLSFINECDPVARADKAYVKSLLELLAAPAPNQAKDKEPAKLLAPAPKHSKTGDKKSKSSVVSKKSKISMKSSKSKEPDLPGAVWRVPHSTLSNAGRIVVLRSGNPHAKVKRAKTVEERLNEGVVAQVATDEQLRGLIWGDPVCHVMKLYAGRVEVLAVGAVTAKDHWYAHGSVG
ncbi:Uu.00g095060.m01.CDS01 [Anthostomella pinea]|uniref:Uu.00g095060.m01.CDS01 n=1 Tax=Anthostomella pinea TaxID=933095 RepID=A0AAI8VT13_9PEZI|nr:Uu.00g095060.m01.CDS01 [Anthostomella pinea]